MRLYLTPEEEQEDILKRIARLSEYAGFHPTHIGINPSSAPTAYDLNSFAREMALVQSPVESLLRKSSQYQARSLNSQLLQASKSSQYQIPGTDGANLVDSLKGQSFSYTPQSNPGMPGDGASLVYTNNASQHCV